MVVVKGQEGDYIYLSLPRTIDKIFNMKHNLFLV